MKMNSQIWNSMARYLAGEMNMKEEIAFRNSLESDPKQQSELIQMEKSWKYFNTNPIRTGIPGKSGISCTNRLENDGLLEEEQVGSRKLLFAPVLRIAAVILLILAIGIPTTLPGKTIAIHLAKPPASTLQKREQNCGSARWKPGFPERRSRNRLS